MSSNKTDDNEINFNLEGMFETAIKQNGNIQGQDNPKADFIKS